MKRIMLLNLMVITIAFGLYCKKEPVLEGVKATFVQGKVSKTVKGQKSPLAVGDVLNIGDVIQTSKKGLALLSYIAGSSQMEIQKNSQVTITQASAGNKEIMINRGATWFKTDKLKKGEVVNVKTPVTLAGVRGTKFFTFMIGDMVGTCHCEGDVDFSAKGSKKYNKVHHKDSMVFHRGGKTVHLIPEELEFLAEAPHHHSDLKDSPLGPKNDLDPALAKKLFAVVEKKFSKQK